MRNQIIFEKNVFVLLNVGSKSSVIKISDLDVARTNVGASRIGAMVAEEVQNQQIQDKYVTYHMTEKILHCDWLRTGQLIVNREREIKHDVTSNSKRQK